MKFHISKKKVISILLCTAAIFGCCSCGSPAASDPGENPGGKEMGRYVEDTVELGGEGGSFTGMVQEGEKIRLIDLYGMDMVSADGGKTFEAAETVPTAPAGEEGGVSYVAVAGNPDGSRILSGYTGQGLAWRLAAADGSVIELDAVGENGSPSFYSGSDCFYMSCDYGIYRVDSETGETEFLTECASYPLALASNGELLFVAHTSGVLIYDLQKNEAAQKQDEVLSSFFTGKLEDILNNPSSLFLYPWGEDIYVLSHDGIYCHELYGEEMVCIVEGSSCSIGNIDSGFAGMAVTEPDDGGNGEKIFTVLYTDGRLMRYTKDESLPAEPEVSLRIYSLYEDGNIRQAVSAFRQKYPELYIKYEVGVNPEYGVTREDALRNLSTELAAGTGPDVLVMDDIPFGTYAEKGVLEELGFLREGMSEEEYFKTVTDGFATEEGLYVMPLTFAVPVLAGEAGEMAVAGKPESLSQLADILEKVSGQREAQNGQAESVIGFRSAEEALHLFAQSSMGAWCTEEGALDREAVTEFLTQVKRIYDIQIKSVPESMQYSYLSGMDWGSGENALARRSGSYGLSEELGKCMMLFPGQPFCAGYLSSAVEDFPMTLGRLKQMEGEYVQMPGQSFGKCLASTLMAVNSSSVHLEESRLFMEYIFSAEFQGSVSLNGTPVNRSAYLQRQKNPKEGSTGPYITMGYGMADGSVTTLEIYWPSEEDYGNLDQLMDGISGVNDCDYRIYEAVTVLGQAALTGDASIEETVDEIEKTLELYLAE